MISVITQKERHTMTYATPTHTLRLHGLKNDTAPTLLKAAGEILLEEKHRGGARYCRIPELEGLTFTDPNNIENKTIFAVSMGGGEQMAILVWTEIVLYGLLPDPQYELPSKNCNVYLFHSGNGSLNTIMTHNLGEKVKDIFNGTSYSTLAEWNEKVVRHQIASAFDSPVMRRLETGQGRYPTVTTFSLSIHNNLDQNYDPPFSTARYESWGRLVKDLQRKFQKEFAINNIQKILLLKDYEDNVDDCKATPLYYDLDAINFSDTLDMWVRSSILCYD